eukprot:9213448-Heterocapsa_arctica.AAC.1
MSSLQYLQLLFPSTCVIIRSAIFDRTAITNIPSIIPSTNHEPCVVRCPSDQKDVKSILCSSLTTPAPGQ